MCGIFGYIGKQDPKKKAIEGLKKLEYRGYDSSGIVSVVEGSFSVCRAVGPIANMEKKAQFLPDFSFATISHTRWATHGSPTEINAHPHLDQHKRFAVVHNGIIENHRELRKMLEAEGVVFQSETDTEVVAQLLSFNYRGDVLETLKKTRSELKGSFAIAAICVDQPNTILTLSAGAPLVIGIKEGEVFISSDVNALGDQVKEVLYMVDGEMALLLKDKYFFYNTSGHLLEKLKQKIESDVTQVSKGDFEHFTLKEIYEQPDRLKHLLKDRFKKDEGSIVFPYKMGDDLDLSHIKQIVILACGTSYHAGLFAANLIEDLVRIPVQVEVSSEFRYKNPIVLPHTLAIAISQSGETADTIAAVKEVKTKAAKVLAICNVKQSTLVRLADHSLFIDAGVEVGVASTKAFTNQILLLSLFATHLARCRNLSCEQGQHWILALESVVESVQHVLANVHYIADLGKKWAEKENFFYMGRRSMYVGALEGALKLKEIAYVNANGYAAGELKHGPIALINPHCLTVALMGDDATYVKMLSSLLEVKARGGPILAIAVEGSEGIEDVADDVIYTQSIENHLQIIPTTVVMQLFAYFFAKERGAEIDQPRNLAKSVTVE